MEMTHEARWTQGNHGEWLPPPKVADYIDFALTNTKADSDASWAEANDLHPDTVKRWKRDERFKELWDKRRAAVIGDPIRVHTMMMVLYENGAKGDGQAARDYMKLAERFLPPPPPPPPPEVRFSEMSDAELAAKVRQLLTDAEKPGSADEDG